MYTQHDLEQLNARIRKRWILLMIPVLILLAATIFSIVMHFNRETSYHWIAYLSLSLIACLILFVDGMCIAPLRAYRRHINSILHGRTHLAKGFFKSIDQTKCMRDNVCFYPMLISVDKLDNEEDDRLFYFDVQMPFPALAVGDAVTITAHDKNVGQIERA